VSIKNKLVTAVTTAGLLAGLFGSAFVPAVRAGVDDAALTVTCTSSDNTGTASAAKQTCTYVSTVTPVIVASFVTEGTDDTGAYSVAVSGSTITNISTTGALTEVTGAFGLTTTTLATYNLASHTTGQDLVLTVTLAKIAAGSSATVTISDDDSTPMTLTVTSIAAAKAGVVAPVATSQSTRTLSDDITADGTAAINGTTTVNNSVDYMALAYDGGSASAAGNYGVTYAVKDAYNSNVDISAKLFTATISPATCGSAGVASTLALAVTAAGNGVNAGVGTNGGALFVNIKHPGADKPCLAAVTVTENVTGTVLHTFSIGFLGETASLALTGPAYLATGLANDTDLEEQITVVAKDAKGITIPGTFANPTFTVTDDLAVDINESFLDDATNGGTADNNIFDLDNAVCAADKEGKTRTIYAEGETLVATGKAKSNTLTITCTGKVAYVSAIAFAKTSYYPSESTTVNFTMKDSAGRVAGIGSYMDNDGFAISQSPATGGSATTEPATAVSETGVGAGLSVKADGLATWTYVMGTAAGVAGFLFDITDNDGVTAGNQQGLFPVRTVVNASFASVSDATLTAGPKKKIATATFGAAAGKKVAFVLENASGVTKTYYRKANASGVAKYTIALRGTWTVYATFGDEITETVTLKK
jgi:hypothetical protein